MNASLAGAICGLIIGVALERLQRHREKQIWCKGWNQGWEAHRDMSRKIDKELVRLRELSPQQTDEQSGGNWFNTATALAFSTGLNPTRRKN